MTSTLNPCVGGKRIAFVFKVVVVGLAFTHWKSISFKNNYALLTKLATTTTRENFFFILISFRSVTPTWHFFICFDVKQCVIKHGYVHNLHQQKAIIMNVMITRIKQCTHRFNPAPLNYWTCCCLQSI